MHRDALFVFACIPLRMTLAEYAHVPIIRLYTGVVALRYLLNMERRETGTFGGKVWWAANRPLHGLLFALASLTGEARYLRADVLFGITSRLTRP